MRRIFSIMLSVVIFISALSFTSVYASEQDETIVIGTVTDEVAEETEDLIEINDTINMEELLSSGETTVTGTITDEKTRAKELIAVKISYAYNSSTKKFEFQFNIDCPTAIIKPKISSATITISKSTSKNGTYTIVDTQSWTNISYTTNYKKSVDAATGHYKVNVNVKPAEGVLISLSNGTAYWCINRTGNIWIWNYTDSKSGKSMSEPYTGWSKNALYTRPSNLNTTYKTWYDKTYSTNLNLTNKQVHHIRPLAYGGDNTMSNLIHLDTTFHSGVTAWFAGY